MPFGLGFFAAAGASAAGGAYDLLETTVLGTSASSVTFSGLGAYSAYKHLQIRAVMKSNSGDYSRVHCQVNGITSGSYTAHNLRGNGSSVTSTSTTTSATQMEDIGGFVPGTFFEGEGQFSGMVMDILDYTNTSKNTTFRSLSGYKPSSYTSYVFLSSGVYLATSAITSISLFLNANSFVAGSRFSLYGVR